VRPQGGSFGKTPQPASSQVKKSEERAKKGKESEYSKRKSDI
jgi:hypothetical protein